MRAAALTYTTILALVPALAIIFSALGLLGGLKTFSQELEQFLFKNLATGTGSHVVTYLHQMIGKVRLRTVGMVGFGTFLVTSLLMISSVESSINRIWGIRKPKKFWRRFLVYNLFLIVAPLCAAISISVSTIVLKYFPSMLFQANLTSVLILTIFLGTVYKTFPNQKVSLVWALVAAFLVAISTELAKWGYSVYTTKALVYNKVYGGLAVLPFFLIWIYLSWNLFLGGALLHYLLERRDYFRTVVGLTIFLALTSSNCFAGTIPSAIPPQWYVQQKNGAAIAVFREELELREKGKQVAIMQKWKEPQGKETVIGAVAKNSAGFPIEAFYVEVKEPNRSYAIDGRMQPKALKVRVKHITPPNQAKEETIVREEAGMILSLYLPQLLSNTPGKIGVPIFFNAIMEDAQDGSYEPKVGKALFIGTEKIGETPCRKFLITFQEVKSEWSIEPNGSVCRVNFPKENVSIERTTEALANKAFGG